MPDKDLYQLTCGKQGVFIISGASNHLVHVSETTHILTIHKSLSGLRLIYVKILPYVTPTKSNQAGKKEHPPVLIRKFSARGIPKEFKNQKNAPCRVSPYLAPSNSKNFAITTMRMNFRRFKICAIRRAQSVLLSDAVT